MDKTILWTHSFSYTKIKKGISGQMYAFKMKQYGFHQTKWLLFLAVVIVIKSRLLLDKNPLEAGKLLYALVAKDMLLSTNKGRWTTYIINKEQKTQGVKTQGVERQGVERQGVERQGVERQGVERQGVEKARSNKKEKIIERIIAFCQEPHTLQEIAQELGFSDRYKMKRKYINPLLGDVLQMTSVESKNAPTQKYVVISK